MPSSLLICTVGENIDWCFMFANSVFPNFIGKSCLRVNNVGKFKSTLVVAEAESECYFNSILDIF